MNCPQLSLSQLNYPYLSWSELSWAFGWAIKLSPIELLVIELLEIELRVVGLKLNCLQLNCGQLSCRVWPNQAPRGHHVATLKTHKLYILYFFPNAPTAGEWGQPVFFFVGESLPINMKQRLARSSEARNSELRLYSFFLRAFLSGEYKG